MKGLRLRIESSCRVHLEDPITRGVWFSAFSKIPMGRDEVILNFPIANRENMPLRTNFSMRYIRSLI
jgi:hypothetical protein